MNFIKEQNDIINAVIRPFVVEQPYEVPGGFYMSSSSNKNNEEFTIGDRVFFIENHGLGVFGNVTEVEYDCLYCTKLLVRADDMQLYEICGDRVTNLEERN